MGQNLDSLAAIPVLLPRALYIWNAASGAWDKLRTPVVRKDINVVAIVSASVLWTPASGKTIRLMGGIISVDQQVNVLFQDGGGNYVARLPFLPANAPFGFDFGNGIVMPAGVNATLKVIGSGAANLTGTVWGCEE